LPRLDEAMAQAASAALQFDRGNYDAGADAAQAAANALKLVAGELTPAQLEAIMEPLAALQRAAKGMLDREAEVRGKVERLAKAARNDAGKDAPGRAEVARDTTIARTEQEGIRNELLGMTDALAQVKDEAVNNGRTGVAMSIDDAVSAATRGSRGAVQQMTDAAAALAQNDLPAAAESINRAEGALDKFAKELERAALAVAPTAATAVKLAALDAERIGKELSALTGQPYVVPGQTGQTPPTGRPGDSQAAEGTPSQHRAQGATRAAAQAAKQAAQAAQQGAQQAAQAAAQQAAQGAPLAGTERKETANRVALDMGYWTAMIADRGLSDSTAFRQVAAEARDTRKLESKLDADTAYAVDMMRLVGDVHQMLEKALQSQLEAERMKAAEREECPPQYGPLVKRYFMRISGAEGKESAVK
ncbi:MAG TPA: hypothetical protein VMW52_02395, partial [Phycisphaerae bacterium]|nr:hypothetical protein [Phycisphaerae bacterium]